jgi:hypothetical protein
MSMASGFPPHSPSASHRHSLSQSFSQIQQQQSPQKKRRSLLVKIKDFAFASTDDRHAGLGADVPKPNRVPVLNRFHHRSRTASAASHLSVESVEGESDDDDREEDDDGGGQGGLGDGWGGFKWGFGRFSGWGFGRGGVGMDGSSSSTAGTGTGIGDFPSKTDFARNFAEEPETYEKSGGGGGLYSSASSSSSSLNDSDDEAGYQEEEEEPLYPGLYRALYAFEPEGTAEMKLEEDQVVRVIGRGGGVGWAVVERGWVPGVVVVGTDVGEKGHALVPESYLEVVRLDDDEFEEGEEGDGGTGVGA